MLSLASVAACASATGVSTSKDVARFNQANTTQLTYLLYRVAYHALEQLLALRHASPSTRSARVTPYTPQSTM